MIRADTPRVTTACVEIRAFGEAHWCNRSWLGGSTCMRDEDQMAGSPPKGPGGDGRHREQREAMSSVGLGVLPTRASQQWMA
eukprot:CAMPEP_0204115130 /NCGR_PEP_ID=MMETSP0361-20130328/4658_1 /ASSEMBLY_ACC=CAM_ASM_000343 /TAXON_ID=268821 /ORGANISM="Scrippsiella Hangoei, Strain SHTV-5" /LENGTH=81 /DNA_ID=CAMNT_0051065759 /DNA_START=165 /DNA_END=411 /DNA_ORIENTATION=-